MPILTFCGSRLIGQRFRRSDVFDNSWRRQLEAFSIQLFCDLQGYGPRCNFVCNFSKSTGEVYHTARFQLIAWRFSTK